MIQDTEAERFPDSELNPERVVFSWCPWLRHRWLPAGVGTQQDERGRLRSFVVCTHATGAMLAGGPVALSPLRNDLVLVGGWDDRHAALARERFERGDL